jgi:dihydroneopterin aldolase
MITEIYLENVQAFCRLGIYENERKRGQAVIVNLRVALDLSSACTHDRMEDSISYVDLSHTIQDVSKAKEYNLIEHLSKSITDELFKKFARIDTVDIRIHKPVINAEGFNGNASVRVCTQRS